MFRETEHLPSFDSVLAGHAMTGAVLAVLFGAGLGVLAWILPQEDLLSGDEIVGTACLAMVLSQGACAVVHRIVSWKRQFNQPGSPWLVATAVLSPPAGGYAGALLVGAGDSAALVAAGTATLIVVPFLLFMDRPWKDGASSAEVQQKIEQTRAMTEEIFKREAGTAHVGAGYDQSWVRRLMRGNE